MILLRTLRKDYARYTKEAELDDIVSTASLLVNSAHTCSVLLVSYVTNWIVYLFMQ